MIEIEDAVMPLTDDEKDRIRETEVLKNEIQKALQPAKGESFLSDFGQQLTLLCVGFILTGLIGGALTAYWKNREANNQRQYLEKQRALDRAYSLISQTSKEVAATVAATDDILASYYENGWTTKEINERHDNWIRTSRNWRVNCQVLRAQIAPTFPESTIKESFDEIIKTRRQLGNAIINLPRGKRAIKKDKSLRKALDDATELNNKVAELLYRCVEQMTKQVNKAGQ